MFGERLLEKFHRITRHDLSAIAWGPQAGSIKVMVTGNSVGGLSPFRGPGCVLNATQANHKRTSTSRERRAGQCPNLLEVGAPLPRRTAVPQHRRHQIRGITYKVTLDRFNTHE